MNAFHSVARILPVLALTLASLRSDALEVTAHSFGFDGSAVPGRISLLSIQVANPSSQPYDQIVSVSSSSPMGGATGVRQDVEVFLAPGASRWIQVPVLCDPVSFLEGSYLVEWDLNSPFRGSFAIDPPKSGAPATVFLTDPGNPLSARPRLQTFDENLWPTALEPAAEGLHAVVLDHAPRWEAIREQVFLDWLKLGGTLHLLNGTDDKPPVFSGALSVLNDPASSFRVGVGRVWRHEVRAAKLRPESLEQVAGTAPRLPREDAEQNPQPPQGDCNTLDQTVFDALRNHIRPRHAWGLITLVLLAYVLLIGPGTTILARRWKNSRTTLLYFFAVVAGASALIFWIGRRGYGESTRCLSMTYARHVEGDGRVAVRQWMHVFSTNGRRFTLQHPVKPAWFHNQSRERIRGTFQGGADGRFTVDMPVFSSVDYTVGGYRDLPAFKPVLRRNRARAGGLELDEHASELPPGTLAVYAVTADETVVELKGIGFPILNFAQ
ncbi:MAG: hypothetical protein U1F77_11615, partial [Kiritimatiellia bacterium]